MKCLIFPSPCPCSTMATKHWSWGHFTSDNHFFQNNNSYKSAWCIACVNHHKEQLRLSDIANTAITGISSGHSMDADWEVQGSCRTEIFKFIKD